MAVSLKISELPELGTVDASDLLAIVDVVSGVTKRITVANLDTGGGANSLSGLSDVTLTTPATGAVLYKSAGDWLDTDAIVIDPAGRIDLKFNDATTLKILNDGVDVLGSLNNDPATSGIQDAQLKFANSGGTEIGDIGWLNTTGLNIRNLVHGGDVILQGQNLAGDNRSLFSGDPDGEARLFNNGIERLAATPTGIDVTGSIDISATTVLSVTTLGSGVVNSSLTSVGTLSVLTVSGTVTGPSGTWDSGGMDIATADTYAINGVDVLNATTLGTSVINSSLEVNQGDTGAVNQTIEGKFQESRSVQDYMTTAQRADVRSGTGAVDVTTAVQAAYDAIPSAGANMRWPAGRYLLSAQITSTDKPIATTGDGIGNTVLEWTLAAATRGFAFTENVDTNYISVTNMSLLTLGVGVGTAVTLTNTGQISGGVIQGRTPPRAVFEDLSIEGTTGTATDGWNLSIDCVDVMHGIIDRCHTVGHHGASNFDINSDGAYKFSGTGNLAELVVRDSWAFFVDDALLVSDTEGLVVDGCNFVAVTRGIKVANTGEKPFFPITNTHINAYETCIDASFCGGMLVTTCLFLARNDGDATVDFVFVRLSDCDRCKFVHMQTTATGATYNTKVGYDFVSNTTRCEIDHPFMEGLDTGIRFASGVDNNKVWDPIHSVVTDQYDDSGSNNRIYIEPVTKHKEVADTAISDIVLTDDSELSGFVLEEDSFYRVTGFLRVDSAASAVPDIKFRLQTSTAHVDDRWQIRRVTASGAVESDTADTTDTVVVTLLANDSSTITLDGTIQTNATSPPTIDFQFAQNTSDAAVVTVNILSHLRFERLN